MPPFDLNKYIAPEHLQKTRRLSYLDQFRSNALKLIKINGFLNPSFASKCTDFLSNEASYQDVYGLYRRYGDSVTKTEWLSSPEEQRFYFYQMLSGHKHSFSSNALRYMELRQLLLSIDFKHYIESIVGNRLGDITPIKTHRMQSQHFLKKHNDLTNNRVVAFIVYLSSNWHISNGGDLCIVDNDDIESQLEPTFNSLTLFDVTQHKYHYVSKINDTKPSKQANRISINGWFYEK